MSKTKQPNAANKLTVTQVPLSQPVTDTENGANALELAKEVAREFNVEITEDDSFETLTAKIKNEQFLLKSSEIDAEVNRRYALLLGVEYTQDDTLLSIENKYKEKISIELEQRQPNNTAKQQKTTMQSPRKCCVCWSDVINGICVKCGAKYDEDN